MEDDRGRINIALPEKVRRDQALMRRLHHRVVDLLADKGMLGHFAEDVEERLATLGAEIVSDFVAGLLKEGRSSAT
jgi:hypothetical protein